MTLRSDARGFLTKENISMTKRKYRFPTFEEKEKYYKELLATNNALKIYDSRLEKLMNEVKQRQKNINLQINEINERLDFLEGKT